MQRQTCKCWGVYAAIDMDLYREKQQILRHLKMDIGTMSPVLFQGEYDRSTTSSHVLHISVR